MTVSVGEGWRVQGRRLLSGSQESHPHPKAMAERLCAERDLDRARHSGSPERRQLLLWLSVL